MFSKSCQYALQAILYIAMFGEAEKPITLKSIASTQDIPIHFLGKIMQILAKNKIVKSTTGPRGGFYLLKSPKKFYLIEIVEAIDGLDIFDQCGIGFKKCSDLSPCPLHEDFKKVKQEIKNLLSSKSVAELCNDVKNGNAVVSFKLIEN